MSLTLVVVSVPDAARGLTTRSLVGTVLRVVVVEYESLTTVLSRRPKIAQSSRIATTAIAAIPHGPSQKVVVVGEVVVTSVAVVVVRDSVPIVASPVGAA